MTVFATEASTIAATIAAFRIANAPTPGARAHAVRTGSSVPFQAPPPDHSPAVIIDIDPERMDAVDDVAVLKAGLDDRLMSAVRPRAQASSGHPSIAASMPAATKAASLFPLVIGDDLDRLLDGARVALDRIYLDAAGGDRLTAALIARNPAASLVGELDRRTLFALVENFGEPFSQVERAAARIWLARVADEILSGLDRPWPFRSAPNTLSNYLAHLGAAGPEERSSAEWLVQRAATHVALDRLGVTSAPPAHAHGPDVRLAAVMSALEAPVHAPLRAAEAAGLIAGLRDVPLLGTGYLTPEMLLVGLLALQRAFEKRPASLRAEPKRAESERADVRQILPLGASWESSAEAGPLIADWEAREARLIPATYRDFIETFNGGRIYPNMFAYSVPLLGSSSTAAMTFLDRLHDWGRVEAAWRGEAFGASLPPDMLAIGCDPGGMEILLSLRPEDGGAVVCWMHSQAPWGAATNDRTFPLAASFGDFLAGLRDVPERAGFRYWDRPALRSLLRSFTP